MAVVLNSLRNVFGNDKIKLCDLVKMDCEGAEYEIILKLQANLLSKIKNFVIEYHNSLTEHNHEELIAFLDKNGFKITIKRPPLERRDIGIIYAKR